jgi:CRP/FNR family transcriptional regulator
MEELVKKQFPFFESGLRDAIIKHGTLKTFESNEELIREDQFIRAFPIVIRGVIKICRTDQDGNELLLYYLKSGEVCTVSLTCCMDRTRSQVKAIAEETSEAILIPVELIDSWISEYQTWKEYVMHAMKIRFDELLNTLDSIAFMKMDDRLIRFFKDRYKTSGLKVYKGSHQDIAVSLNTSREVISRLLKKMEREKMITLSRNRVDYSSMCD